MRKPIFALLALAISLFGTQCWAQSCSEEANCHTFSPGNTTFTYFFTDGSQLTVQFVTVLTSFDLRVSESHPTDSTAICEGPCPNPIVLDPTEFPSGTVCARYPTNPQGICDQYDFTGNAGGPHGVPVRNTDYKGLITLILSYFISGSQTVHTPAFGHAPGDVTTFTEDILIGYFEPPPDPTMDGSTPGLSSVVPLDKPFVESGDSFCSLTLQGGPPFHVGQVIEVDFRLTNGTDCSTGIRDKTARFSLAMTDSFGKFLSRPVLQDKEEGNKFHWDHKAGVNEFDLSTVGLAPGNYTITVFSSKVSPQSVSFVLAP
jgi:hypothetical protein